MMLPIKLICSSKKVRKDGTSLVFLQYCYNANKKTLLNTEIAIPARYWLKKYCRISEEMPKAFGQSKGLNKELQRQIRLAEDIINYAVESKRFDPVTFIKKIYKPAFNLADLSTVQKSLKQEDKKINLCKLPYFWCQSKV